MPGEADLFFPHLRQTALVLDLQVPDALIEGVGFLPRHIVALRDRLPIEVRACFLGRSSATAQALFGHATDHRIYERLSGEERNRLAERHRGLVGVCRARVRHVRTAVR